MGLTNVKLSVRRHREDSASREIDFLVDSGAVYTVVPRDVLAALGVEADDRHEFTLANGERIAREVGDAYFWMEDHNRGGYAKVIFGEPDDSNLLGVLTLEALGLALDPLKRQLRPLPMLLM